ncbi:peptidoglycan DD-metalloendopeptidase family protein [Actinocatenispora sera]|uniref:M23 family metallopeptidase n=1 Tax=Actinocatenispora sera TaxID=390989 RepID=UPI0033F74EDC
MNPLSLLFRALDSALRWFLSLRTTPWRRRAGTAIRSFAATLRTMRRRAAAALLTFWTTLRTTPWRQHARTAWTTLRTTPWRQHARTAWTTLRTTPWRRHARTAAARVSDPRWWREIGGRTVALARRPRALRIGVAALLGGVVIAASATTAVAVHTGDGAPAAQAAETTAQHSNARQHTAASRGQDRPVPGDSGTPSREPAKPAKPQQGARQPAKQHDAHKPEKQRKARRPGAKPYVDRGSSWRLPVHAKRFWVSSRFGTRWGVLHAGVDLAVPMRTPVHAAHAGRVSIAGTYGGYGRAVGIENGQGVATVYGHNSKVLVHDGQWVRAGQVIALSGNTGDSHGPHLHFEMRRHGVPFNPLPYLKAHGVHVLRAAGHG